MTEHFDRTFWEEHWRDEGEPRNVLPVHPVLEAEIADLVPGTALEAGSGEGAEADWLASRGWRVTAVDISRTALARAASRTPVSLTPVSWTEADLTVWRPPRAFDLVTTFYAHPTIPQLAFYERIAGWVAPGGTLLIVGHYHHRTHDHGGGQGHPESAVVDPSSIRALLDPHRWTVQSAAIRDRTVGTPEGSMVLSDVIVRARRTALESRVSASALRRGTDRRSPR